MATEIFRCVAGSRLFGTAIPTSDWDYKTVFVPDARDILLGRGKVKQSSTGSDVGKNGSDDVDQTGFPLQKYVSLLTRMETNALEMLFAPNMVKTYPMSEPWGFLKGFRFKLLTTNKKAFTEFGKSQAMRYAVRGDRLEALSALVGRISELDWREAIMDQVDAAYFWDIPHVKVVMKPQPGDIELPFIDAFGRQVCMTVKPKEAARIYQKPIDEMGRRSREAAQNGGADWKGLYHACRIVDEGHDLFSTGEIRFPCENASAYMAIRTGQLELDHVLGTFEENLARLEELTPISDFREKADMDWAEDFVSSVYREAVEEEVA